MAWPGRDCRPGAGAAIAPAGWKQALPGPHRSHRPCRHAWRGQLALSPHLAGAGPTWPGRVRYRARMRPSRFALTGRPASNKTAAWLRAQRYRPHASRAAWRGRLEALLLPDRPGLRMPPGARAAMVQPRQRERVTTGALPITGGVMKPITCNLLQQGEKRPVGFESR
jgi:hypothetical protein